MRKLQLRDGEMEEETVREVIEEFASSPLHISEFFHQPRRYRVQISYASVSDARFFQQFTDSVLGGLHQ